MARAGPGSMHHLSTELLQSLTGIQMTHVPYKATPPAMNDLLAGHIQVLFGDTTSVLPFIQQGTVRGVAVTTAKRSPAAPDIPAVAETVPGYESASWQMLVAPGATPPEVIALLNREVHAIFSDPAVIAELERRGIGPAVTGTPDGGAGFRQAGDRALERRGAPRRPRGQPVTPGIVHDDGRLQAHRDQDQRRQYRHGARRQRSAAAADARQSVHASVLAQVRAAAGAGVHRGRDRSARLRRHLEAGRRRQASRTIRSATWRWTTSR